MLANLFRGDQITYTNEGETIETLTEPTLQNYSPVTGNRQDPKVLIYVYSNFACTSCADLNESITDLLAQTDEVAVIWKDFPNVSLYPDSVEAAVAARCALDQDQFWPYHDRLFDNRNSLSRETYLEIATALELNEKKFTKCLDGQKTIDYVRADLQEAIDLGLTAAPTIFVGSERRTGALRPQELVLLVSQVLEAIKP